MLLALDLLLALQQWLHHDACKPGARVCWIRPGVCAAAELKAAAAEGCCSTASYCLQLTAADLGLQAVVCCTAGGHAPRRERMLCPAAAIAWSCVQSQGVARCIKLLQLHAVQTRTILAAAAEPSATRTPLPICWGLSARPTCLCSARLTASYSQRKREMWSLGAALLGQDADKAVPMWRLLWPSAVAFFAMCCVYTCWCKYAAFELLSAPTARDLVCVELPCVYVAVPDDC